MTITEKTMSWLDQNRYRSYPMSRDEWRKKVSPTSGLDSVLLDVTVFDADSVGSETLVLERISVSGGSRGKTEVSMSYGGTPFVIAFSEGSTSGFDSFWKTIGALRGNGIRGASISIVFSSHKYILERVGEGSWELGCPVLMSRVVRLTNGVGVDVVSSRGSAGVQDHFSEQQEGGRILATGDIVLEDGYRTSPAIYDGKILVRVGKRYGHDPCRYNFNSVFGESVSSDCRVPLFFFCGQNAINSRNIVIRGGRGISVIQGRSYEINDEKSKCNGKSVPCIEIVAGKDLIDICRPNESSTSSAN